MLAFFLFLLFQNFFLFGQCGPFQVYESFGTAGTSTLPIQGGTWTQNSIGFATTVPRTGTGHLSFNANGDFISTPKITNPGVFSFWFRRSGTSATHGFVVETSPDNVTWTQVDTYSGTMSTTYVQYTKDLGVLSLSNIYVRVRDVRASGATLWYIDDMSWTSTIATNNTTLIQGATCSPSIICGITYNVYDRGGVNDEYSASMSSAPMVITPSSLGGIVSVNITGINIDYGYDYLKIYNGNSITSNAFPGSAFTGTTAPGLLTASNPSGAITIDFTSDGVYNGTGFVGTVTCTVPSPCSGTPAPGSTITSATSVTSGSTVNLSLQNSTSGTGVSYQWQSSSDNTSWTDITGATSATYTATVNAPTWYRCKVICSGNTGYSSSGFVDVIFCSSIGYDATKYINNFQTAGGFSNISNLGSGFSSNGYGQYNSFVSQSAGGIINFSTSFGSSSSYTFGFGVWVDWNNDHDFSDAGENVFISNSYASSYSGSFSVPIGVLPGTFRMRIVTDYWSASPSPCNSTSISGETEDYLVTVISSTPCSGIPNAGIAAINNASGCFGTTITLSASGLSSGAGITYQWQAASSSSGPWTDITGATSFTYSTTPSATTYYQIKTSCSNSGLTNTTNSVSFTSSNCYVMSNNLQFVTTCSGTVYDSGGSSGNYGNNESKVLIIRPTSSDQIVTVTGTYNTQSGSDFLTFDYGEDDDILSYYGAEYTGSGSVTFSSNGPGIPLVVQFDSDVSSNASGFSLSISCTCVKPTAITYTAPSLASCSGTSSITITDVTAPDYKPWVMTTLENNVLNSLTWLPISPANAWLGNNTSIGGQQVTLTTASTSKNGSIVFGPYGQNQNEMALFFNMFVGNGSIDGDGMSFSYGPDISTIPTPNTSTTPSATFSTSPYYFEMGIGSGLKISFDAFENGFDPNFPYCGGSNIEGIYLIYNNSVIACYSSSTSTPFWLDDTVFVQMFISSSGQLTMYMDGSINSYTIFNDVQLPSAYLNADKSSWKAAFAARTGTSSLYSGRNKHMVDDINIFHYVEYEYSIDGTTWQASNSFPNLQAGTYTVYVRIKGQTCSYNQSITIATPTTVTPTFTNATAICTGGASPLPTISTNNIGGTWSPAFNNTTTTTYTFTPNYGQCAVPVTSTITVDPCGPFTSCNLVVNKIGDGTTALSGSSTSISVQEISPAGSLVQTISSSNFTGNNLLTQNGSSTSIGFLNSYNDYLAVPGHNTIVGTASVNSLNTKAMNILGTNALVSGRYLFPTGGPLATPISPFSANALRSALATSSSTFYCSGTSTASGLEPNTGGIWYYNGSGFIPVSNTFNNVRNIEIFNGQLYYSTGSYDVATSTYSQGIYAVGVGLPTTTNQTANPFIVSGTSASTSPNDFSISPDGCTAYIADDATTANNGGVQKWSKASGTWQLQYTIPIRSLGMVVDYSGTNPIIYVTTYETSNNKIVKIIDNGTLTSVLTTDLMLAGTNYAFRGIDFTPNSYKPITVSQQPQSANYCQNANAVTALSVSATSAVSIAYQWYSNTTNSFCGATAISGATSATYTPPVSIVGTIYYFVRMKSSCATIVNSNIATITIYAIPSIPVITAGGPTTFCQGENVVLSTTNVQGLSYQWQKNGSNIAGATGYTYTATTTGSYTVIVTNSNNCSAQSVATSVTVNPLPALPVVTASGPTTFCQGGNVILSTTNLSGLTYQWQKNGSNISGATGTTYTATTSGTYTVIATNNNNCSSTSTATTITINPLPSIPIIIAGGATIFCQGENVVLSTNNVSGLSYQWQQNGSNISGATGTTYTATTAGTYTVIATNNNNCSSTAVTTTVTVNPLPSLPVIDANGSTSFCEGDNVILSTTNVLGLSYQWQNNSSNILGATANTYTATTAGIYTVIATNSNNCSSISSATTVIVNALPSIPVITTDGPISFCEGENVILSTTDISGLSFQWQNNGSAIMGETSTFYTATASGSYTVVAINNENCFSTSEATTVTVNALPPIPVITADGSTTFCQGDAVLLSVTDISGLTFQWQNSGTDILGATTSTYNATSSGEYTVITTNIDNCFSIANSIVVTVTPMPSQPATTNCWDNYQFNASICDWENIGSQPQQPTTINCWDDYQFNSASCTWENVGVQPQQPTAINCWDDYQFNATSCEWENVGTEPQQPSGLDCNQIVSWNSATCSWEVQTNPLDAPLFSILSTACYGSTIILPGISDNGISGTWSPAIDNTQTTTYTFTPSSGQCAATEDVTITITPNASVSTLSGTTSFNIGGSETFIATAVELGGGTGVWSSSDPSIATVDPITGIVSAVASGTCEIIYAISGGCGEATESIIITVSQNLQALVATTNQPTCSVATGTVTVTTPIPASGITYTLIGINPVVASQSNATGVFTNLSSGEYELTYSMSNLTSSVYPTTINSQPSNLPGPSVGPITQPTCSVSTGSIQVMNPTPTPDIEFTLTRTSPTSWVQSNFTGTFSGLSSGVYELTYTNELGCTSLPLTFTIFPFANTPTVSIDNATICSGESTTLTATASPSGGTFLWSNSQTLPSINVSPLSTATYNVYYTLPGCTAVQATATVTVKPIPSVSIASSLPVICPGVTTTLAAIPSIGGGTYAWTPGNYTSQTISATPANTSNYSVVYTLNGCSSNAESTTITVSAQPTVTVTSANNSLCIGESTILTATPSIGGGTMQWTPTGEITNEINVQPTTNTTYSIAYTVNGCTVSSSTEVTVAQKPSVEFTSNVSGGCAPLHVDFESSQTAGVTYKWLINGMQLSGNTINYTFNDEDCYDIQLIADQSGCKDSILQSDYICVTSKPTASFVPSSLVFSEYDQEISFTNQSQGAEFYVWDFGDGSISEMFQPTHVFNETENGVLISLTAISSSGCQDEFHLTIPFEPHFLYYVPNTFTPNGNALNETFKPIISPGIDIYNYTLLIYNRWGELIFESHDIEIGWDGTYGTGDNKMQVQDGLYTWKMIFKDVGNADRKVDVGTVNLMR